MKDKIITKVVHDTITIYNTDTVVQQEKQTTIIQNISSPKSGFELFAPYFTGVVALLGIAVAYWNIKRQVVHNSKQLWINNFRTAIAVFMAQTNSNPRADKNGAKELHLATHTLMGYLEWNNRKNEEHIKINSLVWKIVNTVQSEEMSANPMLFIDYLADLKMELLELTTKIIHQKEKEMSGFSFFRFNKIATRRKKGKS